MKPSHPTRRDALGGLAAFGAGALVAGAAGAQTPPLRGLIDIHHHFYPPPFVAAANAYGAAHGKPPVGGPVGAWTTERTLAEMDASGIATSILSLASFAGVMFDLPRAQWAPLARSCNDYAAGMMRDHPGRFGLFATLPLPDVDAALAETAYALDTLKADGIGIPTSWGDSWPGDAAYAPLWAELDRRKAIVVFHPLAPACCTKLVGNAQESYLEYPYDTGRAVESLLLSGTLRRYRDIRWTFCHGGGPVPVLTGRIETLTRVLQRNIADVAPDGIEAEIRRLYFDTANASYAPPMAALLALVPVSHVMFGTDYPYVSGKINVDALVARNLPPATLAAIARDNARRLIPRLRA